jgi:hypothetical protein
VSITNETKTDEVNKESIFAIEGIDDDSQNNNDIKDPQKELQVSIKNEIKNEIKTESNFQMQQHNKNEEENDDSQSNSEEKKNIKEETNPTNMDQNIKENKKPFLGIFEYNHKETHSTKYLSFESNQKTRYRFIILKRYGI